MDVSRGEHNGRVSSEWFSRPDDEKYLSLSELYASVQGRAEQSRTRTMESAAIRVEAHRDDQEKLALVLPDAEAPVAPTHWSFGQLGSLVSAPAAYLRQLPAPFAGINLQCRLTNHRTEQAKTMDVPNGRTELRAVTGPDYGRIHDHELVSAVQRIAGDGVGDTRWKEPGVLDWSTSVFNPMVDVTKDTTTLYASDRDVFLFLVDDMDPIEAGTLPDGSPDLFFRGLYCWNSEGTQKRSAFRASIFAPSARTGISGASRTSRRFRSGIPNTPPIGSHMRSHRLWRTSLIPRPFTEGIRAARERIVARSDEARTDFLRKRGFSKAETGKIVETVLAEEGRPPESVFDFVQGITAVALAKPLQDARLTMETRAKKLLEQAA